MIIVPELLPWPLEPLARFAGLLLLTIAEGAVAYAVLNETTLQGLGFAAYRRITPRFGTLVVAALAWGLAVFVGFLLLVVPGCLLIARWSVYVPTIVAEPDSGLGFRRSVDLTDGHRWTGFWIVVLPIAFFAALEVAQWVFEWDSDLADWSFRAASLASAMYAVVAAAVFYRRLTEIPRYPSPPAD